MITARFVEVLSNGAVILFNIIGATMVSSTWPSSIPGVWFFAGCALGAQVTVLYSHSSMARARNVKFAHHLGWEE